MREFNCFFTIFLKFLKMEGNLEIIKNQFLNTSEKRIQGSLLIKISNSFQNCHNLSKFFNCSPKWKITFFSKSLFPILSFCSLFSLFSLFFSASLFFSCVFSQLFHLFVVITVWVTRMNTRKFRLVLNFSSRSLRWTWPIWRRSPKVLRNRELTAWCRPANLANLREKKGIQIR